MNIKLTERDLQKIFDSALAAIKSSYNTAISSELQATSYIIEAFADHVTANCGECLNLEQPKPRDWESGSID